MKHFFLLLLLLPLTMFSAPGKSSSVLSQGRWWKIAVKETGIHKITYQDIQSLGIDPATVNPATVRVFGNGGKMLPEANILPRPDDLNEVAVEVIGGDDGSFDPSDLIIFYATGPVDWIYNYSNGYFTHKNNLYSDLSYYFLTVSNGTGKRVTQTLSADTIPSYETTSFSDYAVYDNDSLSLINSGKLWVGEVFNQGKSAYDFPFTFPSVITNIPARVIASVIAKSSSKSNFYLSCENSRFDTIGIELTDPNSTNVYAKVKVQASQVRFPGPDVNFNLDYDLPNNDSQGWLDFIEINCRRNLVWAGPQMGFRDPGSIGKGYSKFIISGSVPSMRIWDVTREDEPVEITGGASGENSGSSFIIKTDSLKQFIAFDGSFYYPVEKIGEIPNQNLHALSPATMVIVTPSEFAEQAERLAAHHRQKSNFPVIVAGIDQIYNEFSSGKKDIAAIRDFVKMLYDRAGQTNKPKYLLLFGDGTYDPQNRIPGNNDFIPTYQSQESLRPITSYVSDDFYGLMAPNAGNDCNGIIDIGIGRFPVSSPEEAKTIVDKIIHYSEYSDTIFSEWRNRITFIADDENQNVHLQQAEELTGIVATKYPVINISKIYLDAYKMIQTPSGNRLPQVNSAIDDAVQKGTLILNYTGHGGEDGWAAEKVLTAPDINSWTNYDKMPVFVTATCEFSRFDNPGRYTAGEKVLMRPNGGAIALYSTTRLSLATSNFKLDTSFFSSLLPEDGGPAPTMGDLIRISKNRNGNNYAIRNFVLLGDPAQNIAFPRYKAVVTEINEHPVNTTVPDTLRGLSSVKVMGEIRDDAGNRMNGFNGQCYAIMFDKPVSNMTIGNTDDSYPQQFKTQNVMLYHANVPVTSGQFELSFVIPADVRPQFGKGKLSLYARNGVTDANGFDNNIVTGGSDPSVEPDQNGPSIAMYMDDLFFKSGDITGENTTLLADLEDPQGINFLNLGIGHEIVAWLDNQITPVILNEYFNPEAGPYQAGHVQYAFNGLSAGRHSLKLRCWDMFNNSSEKEIVFYVKNKPVSLISGVTVQPNPVRENAVFSFTPQGDAGQLYVNIDVYSMEGKRVTSLQKTFDGNNNSKLELEWNGRGENGQALASGIYLYQLTAHQSGGEDLHLNGKLIKVN